MQPDHTLTVDLGERSYPIYVGTGLLGEPGLLPAHVHGGAALIVSNTTVAPRYVKPVAATLDAAGIRRDQVILDDGEAHKTMDAVLAIVDRLLERGFDRRSTVIAVGGGVVGDIAGFAAAIYQRGVNFIQVPTTLLAQVDSSVGGKTGVNHPLGKNMIGAFYQPRCVLADIDTLATLPRRELAAGLAEVIKYGLIHDADFFAWLEGHMDALAAGEPGLLARAVLESCRIKARVVELDEREAGLRAILNLGHTFGHAIETATGYGSWLHGEAVAAGMAMAVDLSERQGWIDAAVRERTLALLARAGLPSRPPESIGVERFLELMARDKKAVDGAINLVLLRGLGDAVVTADYDPALLRETLSA